MSKEINGELFFFLQAALTGMLLLAAYDVLRIFRRIIKHGSIGVAVEDFIYWFCSSFIIFFVLLKENDGKIRWFFIAGIVTGMLIYNVSISQYIVKFISFIINKILYVVRKVLGFFLRPFRFFIKKLVQVTKRVRRFGRKIGKIIKNGLKKLIKTVKISFIKK